MHLFEESVSWTAVQQPMACAGCGEHVRDRVLLVVAGSAWHGACLRCSRCRCELQDQATLFWRDGQDINTSLFLSPRRTQGGGQCARCFQPIPASDLVMRSGELTFHPQCFSCQECDVALLPGSLYCMQGPNLYCQSHYQAELSRVSPGPNQAPGDGDESVSSPEPRLDDRPAGGRSRRHTKRIRTCFRSEQLRALESYFAQKHNPDGKDWTCLAHKTGLPKRVLQVGHRESNRECCEPGQLIPSITPPELLLRLLWLFFCLLESVVSVWTTLVPDCSGCVVFGCVVSGCSPLSCTDYYFPEENNPDRTVVISLVSMCSVQLCPSTVLGFIRLRPGSRKLAGVN
uniref:LIM/homeobox protein Lhx9 n=1 Tax=Salarias fasciatus TaxID=181472 RepID=A0A672FQG8_SALFA